MTYSRISDFVQPGMHIVLPMLDRYAYAISADLVADDFGVVAVSSPDAVIASR